MPAKSILEIEVNDAAFKQFNALFQHYQRQLKSTPLAWQNIAKSQQQGVKVFRDIVAQQAQSLGQQRLMNDEHKAAVLVLRQQESIWGRLERSTKDAATNFKSMTGEMTKWVSLTAVLSGMVGAGGLFGINHLAGGVAGGRRSALGLGATYGGQRAFATAFDRFVDPGSVLSGVASARDDVSKRVAFAGLGMLNEKDLQGDNAAVAARVLTRAKGVADKTPDQLLGTMFQTYKLGNLGLTENDFRRLKRTSPEEMARQQQRFGKLSRDYDLGGNDQRAYQDFVSALNDASNRIETVFVKGLVPLIPGMEKLSSSIVKSIENLSKAVPPDAMERIGRGIETFAQYLGTEKFQNDVKAFAAAVAWVGGKIKDLGDWTGSDSGSDSGAKGIRDRVNWSKHHRRGIKTAGELRRERAEGKATALGQLGRILFGSSGLPVKPGAGTIDPVLASFAGKLHQAVPGIDRFTSFNDAYHKGTNSAHAAGRAFDFTIKNPAQSAEIADLVRREMTRQGITGTVIDEYKNPSSRSTAGHIHVQTDVRVMNAAGSNVIVSAQQVTPSQ